MNYKVGDKVRVRGDLEDGKRYGSEVFTKNMEKFIGKIYTVGEEKSDSYWFDELIREENINFYFSDDMLRPAEFYILCDTEEEKQAVLEELEKEGYVWGNGGEKPTEWENVKTAPIVFYIDDNEIYQGNRCATCRCIEIAASEFTGIDFSEKIVITKTATGATATYGDKTVTTNGVFEKSSKQALARIWCPFKVGDRVKGIIGEATGIVKNINYVSEVLVDIDDNLIRAFSDYELEPYINPLYNAKLFCIEGNERTFKQGHIYECKDGIFHGNKNNKFCNLEEINNLYCSKFMEVKDD